MADEYIKNVWYMAAWQEEVDGTDMLSRTFLDEAWLIFKVEDGYAIIRDRCPHRFAPLSKGRRCGDLIECGYHGLTFDKHGTCVKNPFSDLIPPNSAIRTMLVEARHGIIWFWPGDVSKADPDLIPDFGFLDDPLEMTRMRTVMNANYELLTDNLMDLSHIEYVHRDSFQSGGAMFKGKHKARTEDDGQVWSCWLMEGVNPPRFATELEGTQCDRWTNMRWNAPANMYLEVGAAPLGVPHDESPIRPLRNPHIITPETQTTSHYFYNTIKGDEAFVEQVFDNEDRPMLEAVQNEMDGAQFWELQPLILNVDAGAVRARRQLMKMRREERRSTEGLAAESA